VARPPVRTPPVLRGWGAVQCEGSGAAVPRRRADSDTQGASHGCSEAAVEGHAVCDLFAEAIKQLESILRESRVLREQMSQSLKQRDVELRSSL